ncbi:hypothetical protein BKA24_001727 [Microbacterium marinum]|uniref:Uncharacterized protein n=1 Tax=Microbacterium marinum TaxID=421115 RepID=A0A7W7BQL6_9MICO|nr:hypothetical protein [Microbacterium marinum]MBB4667018.1 hypothetical protein [Microbacterium marinum]
MNPGVYPISADSPVGRVRIHVGDTESQGELLPPVPGQVNYAVWSDAALEAYLTTAGGNELRAAAHAVNTLAIAYAQQGRVGVRADDLQLTMPDRGAPLAEIAERLYRSADAADAAAADDVFTFAPAPKRRYTCV